MESGFSGDSASPHAATPLMAGMTPSEAQCLMAVAAAGSAMMNARGTHIRGQAAGEWLPFVEATYLRLISRGLLHFAARDLLALTDDGQLAVSVLTTPQPSTVGHGRKSVLRLKIEALDRGGEFAVEVPPTADFEAAYCRVANLARKVWGSRTAEVKRSLKTRTITVRRTG